MSIAPVAYLPSTTRPRLAAVPNPQPQAPAQPAAPAQRERRVPEGAEVRGFALYVGIDEAKALAAGIDLPGIVERIRGLLAEIAPAAETHASVAIAPRGVGGRDIDVVRAALRDPALQRRAEPAPEQTAKRRTGIIVDISRKRVIIDGETAGLTFKEFELLQFLVLREGRTVDRQEIIAGLWSEAAGDDVPNERTIDVHIRRLRSKLGEYEDIVRTVRGVGYRFDRHADVAIRYANGPSPDVF